MILILQQELSLKANNAPQTAQFSMYFTAHQPTNEDCTSKDVALVSLALLLHIQEHSLYLHVSTNYNVHNIMSINTC